MTSKKLKGWQTDILWNILVGATLFVCMYITYQFLLVKGVICLHQSECVEQSNSISEQLFQEECSSFCNTKECTDISQHLLKFMNQSANPCEEFDNFACGLYHETFTDGEPHWIINDGLLHELYLRVKEVLEEISASAPDASANYKLKLVYESCMNAGSSNIVSVSSVEQFLSSVGVVRNRSRFSSSFSLPLSEALGKLSAYGENMFFQLIRKNIKKRGLYEFKVASPDLLLYSNSMDQFDGVMRDILAHFHVDPDETNEVMENFKSVFNFLEENPCEEEASWRSDKLNCADEEKDHLVCQMAESYVINANLSSFYRTERITITCSRDKLDKIVEFLRNTDDRAIANYIAVNVIIKHLFSMGFFFRRQSLKLDKHHTIQYEEERYLAEKQEKQFCVNWIMRNMKFPLGGAFVSRYWPTEATNEIHEIYLDYVHEAKSSIMDQNWITEKTKEDLIHAIEKAQNFMEGLIQDMKNQSFVNSLYETFHPSRSSFVYNVLEHEKLINTAEAIYNKEYFHRYFIEDTSEVLLQPFTNNANGLDDIYLSFGILSSPFYNVGYPRIFNLAKIGELIGHEIGHIINFFIGRLRSTDETAQNWEKKKECIIKQYSKFKYKFHEERFNDEAKKFRATQTVSEDFSDSMGLSFTENVSKPFLIEMESKDFMIPGLPYSPEQLLYISYEQTFCAVRTADSEQRMFFNDEHSQQELRIIGTLQNSERFSKAFNCPSTAYMNRKEKCRVFE